MESQKDRAKTRGASTSLKVNSFSALRGASLKPLAVAHTTEQSEPDKITQSQEGGHRASSSFQQGWTKPRNVRKQAFTVRRQGQFSEIGFRRASPWQIFGLWP